MTDVRTATVGRDGYLAGVTAGQQPRQYLLGPADEVARAAPSDWVHIPMGGSETLCTSPALPVGRVSGEGSSTWWLLGRPYETESQQPEPLTRLGGARWEDLPTLTATWSGKWTIVGDRRLLTDPVGLMGCYYREAEEGSGASPLISSALPLLACGSPSAAPVPVTARGMHMKYMPPPATHVPGVSKLLMSQAIDWRDGRIGARPMRLGPTVGADPAPDRRVERIGTLLQGALVAARRHHGRVWLALTGGHDSRLMLAAALSAGVPVQTFTLAYPDMPKTDRDMPPLLARAAGVPHVLVTRAHGQRKDLLSRFDGHTGRAFRERDRFFYARGQYDFAGPDDVIIRSGVAELGTRSYVGDFPEGPAQVEPPPIDTVVHRLLGREDDGIARALNRWRDWALRHPLDLDWRVRLYWEIRLGGWLSAVEHSLDLVPAAVLQPFDNGEIIRLMLQHPTDQRMANPPHAQLIEEWAPQLATFPYNRKDGRPRRVRRRLRTVARDLLEVRGLR